MGKKDLALKSYLSDPMRYADVYNGSVFGGAQILDGAQLEEAGTAVLKSEGDVSLERTCDMAMRQKTEGGLFALWILENQGEEGLPWAEPWLAKVFYHSILGQSLQVILGS